MSIKIPAEYQPLVRQQLQLGMSKSEQQLVAEALGLLKAEREETVEGIRLGLADAAAGRFQSVADAFADLRSESGLRQAK